VDDGDDGMVGPDVGTTVASTTPSAAVVVGPDVGTSVAVGIVVGGELEPSACLGKRLGEGDGIEDVVGEADGIDVVVGVTGNGVGVNTGLAVVGVTGDGVGVNTGLAVVEVTGDGVGVGILAGGPDWGDGATAPFSKTQPATRTSPFASAEQLIVPENAPAL
jgi:hypothetical protein